MNIKTHIQHTYSVYISDQVPERKAQARGKSSAEALLAYAGTEYLKRMVEERQTMNQKVITQFSLFNTSPLKLVMCFVLYI